MPERREIILVIMDAVDDWAEANGVELDGWQWVELSEQIYNMLIAAKAIVPEE